MKTTHASTLSSAAAKLASLAALLLAFLPGSSSATTINWGTYISPSSYLFDSTGANLNDDYVFELGTFGSFTPTQANMSTWLANWKVFLMCARSIRAVVGTPPLALSPAARQLRKS